MCLKELVKVKPVCFFRMPKSLWNKTHTFLMLEHGCVWFLCVSETNNETFTPTSNNAWPAAWLWERCRALIYSLWFAFFIFVFLTLHVNSQVKCYDCLPGETIWKMYTVFPILKQCDLSPLYMTANWCLPVWSFGTAIENVDSQYVWTTHFVSADQA